MSGNQTVDRAEMQKAAQQIDTKHQALAAVQQRLGQEMAQLISAGGWSGNAANAFRDAHSAVNEQIDKVQASLEMIHEKMGFSLQRYQETEDAQQAAANPILGMIG